MIISFCPHDLVREQPIDVYNKCALIYVTEPAHILANRAPVTYRSLIIQCSDIDERNIERAFDDEKIRRQFFENYTPFTKPMATRVAAFVKTCIDHDMGLLLVACPGGISRSAAIALWAAACAGQEMISSRDPRHANSLILKRLNEIEDHSEKIRDIIKASTE